MAKEKGEGLLFVMNDAPLKEQIDEFSGTKEKTILNHNRKLQHEKRLNRAGYTQDGNLKVCTLA